jgi:diacylglycerol kinase family enzyme
VFVNPAAGGGRAAMLVPVMRDWLAAHAPQARLEVPGDAQAARALAAALPPATRCVLVGGDGTVHQLLPALLQGGHSMGLVPIGSGNDTARALGLHGLGWSQALQRALVAPARTIDVGELQLGAGTHAADGSGTRLFVSSLAAGFDAAVGLRALAGPGWLRGLPRYLHDGPSIFASVLNTPSYGSGMPAMPEARVDDARLDALVAGHFSRLGALRMLPRLLAGTHLGDARIRTRACTVLRVTSDEPWALAADGEPAGRARAWEVRVRPDALPAVAGAPQGTRQSRA